jgi:hypothetical protein
MRFALAASLFLALCGTAVAAAPSQFRTPSSNIGCVYAPAREVMAANLRCDILSGLKPAPRKPQGCTLDWKYGYQLSPTGPARTVCAGDTAVDRRAKAIPYGGRWAAGGFACVVRKTGLRCHNRSGHGFFLSRKHSYRF